LTIRKSGLLFKFDEFATDNAAECSRHEIPAFLIVASVHGLNMRAEFRFLKVTRWGRVVLALLSNLGQRLIHHLVRQVHSVLPKLLHHRAGGRNKSLRLGENYYP